MKVLKHIWVLALAVIFIIPAAGLTYTTHTCNMSSKTSLVLDRDDNCCTDTEEVPITSCCESAQTGTSEDCTVGGDASKCCTNESRYLKEQDEYTAPQSSQLLQFEIVLTIALLFDLAPDEQSLDILSEYNPPPLLYNSKDLLFQNASLLL